MNMKLLLPLCLLALSVGCSSLQVSSDYDKSHDFSQYNTYSYFGWTENSDKMLNQFDKQRIENAVASELNDRGLRYVEKGGDLVVSLFIVVDEKTVTTAYTDHYGAAPYMYSYGPQWGWYGGYGGVHTTYTDHDYLEGTLVIDLLDSEEKRLVWQGVGSKTVDKDPASREKGIARSVSAIMSSLPIKKGK
jgi:hypothetical protein